MNGFNSQQLIIVIIIVDGTVVDNEHDSIVVSQMAASPRTHGICFVGEMVV